MHQLETAGEDMGRECSTRSVGASLSSRAAAAIARMRPQSRNCYGRVGELEVRLAASRSDVRAAQRLRYQVFYEEMSAVPMRFVRMRRRDEDAYDAVCDHLIVVDTSGGDVVGTYRVLLHQ